MSNESKIRDLSFLYGFFSRLYVLCKGMSTGGCASWSKWCTPTKVCLINDVIEIHLQTQATTALWRCLVAAVTSLPFPTSQIPNAHTPSTINRKKNRSRRLQSLSSPPRTQGSRATPPLAMFSTQPVGERHDRSSSLCTERAAFSPRPRK